MSETILSRAIRGLSSSLRFTGSRSGPPGVDLSRASTPVNDLTQYARYGSALVFNQLQDGWVTATFDQPSTEAGFVTLSELWDTQVSGDFGIAANSLSGMMCWIYHVSQKAETNTAVADIGTSRMRLHIARGIGDTVAGADAHNIWLNDGESGPNTVQISALELELVNMVRLPSPVPWPPGALVDMRSEQIGVNPRTVTRRWTLLCRVIPFGVPPLP